MERDVPGKKFMQNAMNGSKLNFNPAMIEQGERRIRCRFMSRKVLEFMMAER
jgi:hypothetical protein